MPIYENMPETLAGATDNVCAIAEAVARFEPVKLLVGEERAEEARKRYPPGSSQTHKIEIHLIEGDQLDLWMRDIAPVFTVEDEPKSGTGILRGVGFNFNGWGGKVLTESCAKLAKTLLSDLNIGRVTSRVTTEGGAIEIDGDGTLIASESSIINDNRNLAMSKKDIEDELSRLLGVTKFLWVPGLKGHDSTDFHIDAVARFVKPGVILFASPGEGENDSWANAHRRAREILANSTDAKGRTLEIIDVTEPRVEHVIKDKELLEELKGELSRGYRWVFSYVNFLMVNGGVVFPQFGDEEADAKAVETARRVFAGREVVPVNVQELGMLGGGIHCASQEVPCIKE